ncbi:MAG: GHKL domain-containing protein [Clostridiaceae bacterium]|nr:GHKL domain-containing protein [Clostridiaceae bacterium]
MNTNHDIMWLTVEACTSLFEILLLFSFLDGFLTPKEEPKWKRIIIFVGAFIVQFVVSAVFYNIPNALIINYCLLSLGISLLLYSAKVTHHIFSCVLLLALLTVTELITVFILVLALRIDTILIQTVPLLKFFCIALKNILSLAVVKLVCNFRKSNLREVGKLYFTFLLLVPIICIGVALIILQLVLENNIDNPSMVLASYLGLMYINAIVFAIFEGLLRQLDKEYRYKLIEKQLELQLNHYNKLAENRALLMETLHDFKNHLNCIYNLYLYNKNEELGNYIQNLINVTNTEKVIDTGNLVIDALLNDKYSIAKKIGIEFKKELNLPANLKVDPTDICAILGNSLDNAIEGCKRIKNSAMRREIALSMTYLDSYLVIVVTNTIDQMPIKEGKFFRSSKPSPELHGLGMHSIERTVKKYDGNMVVKCEQGQFKLEIVMSIA